MARLRSLACLVAVLIAVCGSASAATFYPSRNESNVRFVTAVFRHGDRFPRNGPNEAEAYPTDPYRNYTFEPFGPGQLTLEGRMREFRIGKMLRQRYNRFLGDAYQTNSVAARSTNVDRTKMSLMLALAGLYPPPPSQKWNMDLNWQPIPFTYKEQLDDGLLQATVACDTFKDEYEKVMDSSEVKKRMDDFKPLMDYLTKHSGKEVNTIKIAFNMFHGLSCISSMNLTLPGWAHPIFPGALQKLAFFQYELYSYNDVLKRRNGGMLLHEMIEDMKSVIDGDSAMKGRKINLYSGHETNVAAMLLTLGVFEPHYPAYSSTVMLELSEENGEYYVQVLYYTGIPPAVKTLTIKGCSAKCPFAKFVYLMQSVLPSREELKCKKN